MSSRWCQERLETHLLPLESKSVLLVWLKSLPLQTISSWMLEIKPRKCYLRLLIGKKSQPRLFHMLEYRKRKWKISPNITLPQMFSCFWILYFLDLDHIFWFSQHNLDMKGLWEFESQLAIMLVKRDGFNVCRLGFKVWGLTPSPYYATIITGNFLGISPPHFFFPISTTT